jgi:transcriptional regulator with XRE-family HTH domain
MQRLMTRRGRIRFTNSKATRVGKGIKALRERAGLSRKELAKKIGVGEQYIGLLEEGHEPEIERQTLEDIAEAVGVCRRGTLTDEQLINLFLYANKCEPPKLLP